MAEDSEIQRRPRESPPGSVRVLAMSMLGILGFGVILALYYLQGDPFSLEERSIGSNLSFFALINLLIIGVLVLGFLVVRNLVKLVLDRRRKILGARLRSRLVVAFVGLALIPTVLLFLVAKGILESVLQGWFSPQVAASVDGAVSVAKFHYDVTEAALYRDARQLAQKLSDLMPYLRGARAEFLDADGREIVEDFLEAKLKEYGLSEISIVDPSGVVLLSVQSGELKKSGLRTPAPNLRAVGDASAGAIVVRPEESREGSFVRGYAGVSEPELGGLLRDGPGRGDRPRPGRLAVVASSAISPELNSALSKVLEAFDDYRELKSYRGPLASSYNLTLVAVTLMIVFTAIWVAFYLARSLSGPIQLLAEGTEQIAHGNLDFQVPQVGDDELSVLVESFNKMTADLRETTGELVSRRNYMETVLASVIVGVISLDRRNRIATFNEAAAQMLGIEYAGTVIGKQLTQALPAELAETVERLTEELENTGERVSTASVSLYVGGKARHIEVTATKLVSDAGQGVGTVVLLDDLTELVRAQRMAAWREVVRRIAHEIKNPLTPIQLSAQRMQRRFSDEEPGSDGRIVLAEKDRRIIREATDTIVKQVETLRTLVNEFSQFARMPKSQPEAVDLNELILESGRIFKEAHPGIEISFKLDSRVPVIELDRAQIGRVLVNLIDNAVFAVQERFGGSGEGAQPGGDEVHRAVVDALNFSGDGRSTGLYPLITVESSFDEVLGLVSFKVSDNGKGVADADKPRLFEPYFSKKKGGTGLGLAIVSSIVADHQGFIRVRDNQPTGATFIVELPTSGRTRTAEGPREVNRV